MAFARWYACVILPLTTIDYFIFFLKEKKRHKMKRKS